MNDYKNIYSSITNNQQNLRELIRLTFLNLMSVQGVAAQTIVRNYNNKGETMKTVKQKLEAQVKRIEDTFPQLITNQMYLGTKDHPDVKLWNETSWLVGSWTLSKWRNLKYILKVWNSLDLSKPNAVVLEIDHLLRKSGYYHLAKLLREEQKWEEA
jgi:hypothetical protein